MEERNNLVDKKEEIPKFLKKLPGNFWGVTCFYNPAGYKNKIELYRKFRESSKKQGLKLICVELAFENQNFELEKTDADILVQIKSSEKNIMWQKERLLNIALEHLPKDCDKIAWLDCDVVFNNPYWIKETCRLLEDYIIVQPYSLAVRLPKGKLKLEPDKIGYGNKENQKIHSIAYRVASSDKSILEKSYEEHGHAGFAWAGRREIFDKHKFYDKHILGSGDRLMAYAFYGKKGNFLKRYYPRKLILDHNKWVTKIYKDVKDSVFYTQGLIYHLWHGNRENRFYDERLEMLKKTEFNPNKDIKLDKNKCWIWATNKLELHEWCKKYFYLRNEERAIGSISSCLKTVQQRFGHLPYMNLEKAKQIEKLIRTYNLKNCLELGFYHGKSSAFIASILKEINGHLTTIDLIYAKKKKPNINEILEKLNLKNVTVYYEPKSYTWRLMKMLEQKPLPKFDLCYIDGGHTWDVTGYAFFLIDKLLAPGAWIVFDDINYKFADTIKQNNKTPDHIKKMTKEEIETKQIKKVWELLVKNHPNYTNFREEGNWGFAQKKSTQSKNESVGFRILLLEKLRALLG